MIYAENIYDRIFLRELTTSFIHSNRLHVCCLFFCSSRCTINCSPMCTNIHYNYNLYRTYWWKWLKIINNPYTRSCKTASGCTYFLRNTLVERWVRDWTHRGWLEVSRTYRAELLRWVRKTSSHPKCVQSRTHRTWKCVSFLSLATLVKMYREFYFIHYIISRFDYKHFRGQHTIESNYMQAEKYITILPYSWRENACLCTKILQKFII